MWQSAPTMAIRARVFCAPFLLTVVYAAGCAGTRQLPGPRPQTDIPVLERRVALDSSDVAAVLSLAAAYREANQLEDARALLERSMLRHPREENALLYLGLTYEDLGHYARAREMYRHYLTVGRSASLKARVRARLPLLERKELVASIQESLAREKELAQTAPRQNLVAVFPFVYAGSDSSMRPLGRAMAEMLVTDLSQTERLTVLERMRVQALADELRLGESGLVDPATAARSGRLLGAGRIVQGHILGDEQSVKLLAAVVGVQSGQRANNIASVTEEDAVRRVFDLEKRLALSIYRTLGIELTVAERERVNQRPTQNLQALLAYGMGLQAADAGAFEEAARHFSTAATLDGAFTQARQQADAAAQSAAAVSVSTDALIRDASAPANVTTSLSGVEQLVPIAGGRDATAEVLNREGIGATGSLVEIIIRLPQR
jgi:TolB-like protein